MEDEELRKNMGFTGFRKMLLVSWAVACVKDTKSAVLVELHMARPVLVKLRMAWLAGGMTRGQARVGVRSLSCAGRGSYDQSSDFQVPSAALLVRREVLATTACNR